MRSDRPHARRVGSEAARTAAGVRWLSSGTCSVHTNPHTPANQQTLRLALQGKEREATCWVFMAFMARYSQTPPCRLSGSEHKWRRQHCLQAGEQERERERKRERVWKQRERVAAVTSATRGPRCGE